MIETLEQFAEDKEKAISWGFRILISLVGVAVTTVLWLGWWTLQDVKADSRTGITKIWETVATLTKSQSDLASSMAILSTSLSDHVKTENSIDQDLKDIERDHETRIRAIEQRPSK